MAITIKEIINAIHCLCSIGEQLEKMEKDQDEFKEWIREAIDSIDDRITRLEIIEETINAIAHNP